MRKIILCLLLAVGLMLCLAACEDAPAVQEQTGKVELWISPSGSNENDGTKDKPLATVEAALERLRAGEYESACLYFTDGVHYLGEAVALTGKDHDITFCAPEGATPELRMATPISGWTEETVNGIAMWTAQVEGDFESLFSESASLPQSRWPKEGYFSVKSANRADGYGTTDPNLAMQYAMYVNTDEIKVDGKEFSEVTNLNDVTLKIIHWWKDETVKVQGIDNSSGRVEFSRPATMTIQSGDRYYFQNVFETMSEPGEWYLDRQAGKLYYIPQEGDVLGQTQLYAAAGVQMLTVKGADNIRFEGLRFAMSDWQIPKATHFDCGADHHQAAYDALPAISVTDAENIAFVGCTFQNINSTCLKFGANVQGIAVTDNRFQNIGGNAVFIVGDNVQPDSSRITKDFLISNNLIENYGQVFHNATAVGILHGAGGEISNNEIHDGYSTAITVGWVWGYGPSVTRDVLVKQNLIYNVGQDLLSDMGAIYTLGVKEGVVITENVIHDVRANMEYGYGGWGIYMDEGSSNVLVSKNLVYDCSSTAFYQHYGQDNLITNNIFAFSDQGQIALAKPEQHVSFHLIKNIILSDDAPFWGGTRGKNAYTDMYNFYWDYTRGDQGVNVENYVEKYGNYNMAQFQDPRFADALGRDFELRDFSFAIEAGFVKWDISQAGLKNK